MEGSPIDEICSNQILSKTEDILATQKDNMHDNRTAKLWMQYMNMVDILKKIHQSRTIRKVGFAPRSCTRYATIHCCNRT